MSEYKFATATQTWPSDTLNRRMADNFQSSKKDFLVLKDSLQKLKNTSELCSSQN